MSRWTMAILAGAALAVSGCGSTAAGVTTPRPPAPANLTVYIDNSRVSVSPSTVGAGPVAFVITNQASRMVDDLVRRGFAQRREDEDDRRMKRVCLTDDGRAAIRRLNAARLSGLEQFAHSLTASERRTLANALSERSTAKTSPPAARRRSTRDRPHPRPPSP